MKTSEFHFELPEESIAQTPPAVRGTSRMLVLDRLTGARVDAGFGDLPRYLRAGDVLVLNDSRVLPARLFGVRARGLRTQGSSPDPSGRIEVLLTRCVGLETWEALVRPARKVVVGERLEFFLGGERVLEAEVVGAGEFGERTLRFGAVADFEGVLQRIGHMPLPPYIRREAEAEDSAEDRERYQTVYAAAVGSAAAPTAGLHFTPEMLERARAQGVLVETVTLHVGLGTFQPVRAERVADIKLHAESYTLPGRTAEAINLARREGRRVIAAGTTTTRTLEHCAGRGPELYGHSGETSIFLGPGHRFRVVDGLLTNFHLPESTLLMLVCAFAGKDAVMAAYGHAVGVGYRFFSYGDCMLVV